MALLLAVEVSADLQQVVTAISVFAGYLDIVDVEVFSDIG